MARAPGRKLKLTLTRTQVENVRAQASENMNDASEEHRYRQQWEGIFRQAEKALVYDDNRPIKTP